MMQLLKTQIGAEVIATSSGARRKQSRFESAKPPRRGLLRAKALAMTSIIILLLLIISGCEQIAADAAKAKDEVLMADASFKDVLAKKERLDSEIARSKSSFGEGKAKLLNEISQLRAKLSLRNKDYSDKVRALRTELEPERQALKAKVAELRAALSAKEKALSHIRAIERNASNLAEASDPALNKKLNVDGVAKGFSSQSQAMAAEVASLKERLRILLLKERLLRQ